MVTPADLNSPGGGNKWGSSHLLKISKFQLYSSEKLFKNYNTGIRRESSSWWDKSKLDEGFILTSPHF